MNAAHRLSRGALRNNHSQAVSAWLLTFFAAALFVVSTVLCGLMLGFIFESYCGEEFARRVNSKWIKGAMGAIWTFAILLLVRWVGDPSLWMLPHNGGAESVLLIGVFCCPVFPLFVLTFATMLKRDRS